MTLAEAFDLDGDGEVGVVLVHGFTGTPFEVRYLGEQLARAGFSVRAPLLPGHGTSLDDLDRTTWRDWSAAVDRAIDAMSERCARVAVVGQSLGGLLVLEAASRRRDIACVASLAAPLWLEGWSGHVARRLAGSTRIRRLPKLGGSDVRDRRAKAENPCYDAIPTRALAELLAFMPIVDAALPQITHPVLVLHARHDHTAPVSCAARITERARAERVRILPRSYHLIAADVERDVVAAEVAAFVRRHTQRRAGTGSGSSVGELSCAM